VELSFTKLRVYRECPWKYRLQMVEGRRIPLTPAGSLGLSLHRALECFHRKEAPLDADLWDCYERRWMSHGYPDQETRERWFAKGRRVLEKYLESERGRRTAVVAVEREFSYPLGRHEVRGMIDRIDRHPDGRLEVIDYKTAGEGETLGATDELQLRFYGLGCRESLAMEPALLSVCLVATGRRLTVVYDAEAEARLKGVITEAADRIEAGDFAPDRSFCSGCDFRKTCACSAAQG